MVATRRAWQRSEGSLMLALVVRVASGTAVRVTLVTIRGLVVLVALVLAVLVVLVVLVQVPRVPQRVRTTHSDRSRSSTRYLRSSCRFSTEAV